MIKKVILFMMTICFLNSCAQSTKNSKSTDLMPTTPKITADNYVETMLQSIKKYPEEPYYFLEINNIVGCTYEILINDMPAFKYYGHAQASGEVDIEYFILKSGPQKITYRLHPLGKMEDGGIIDSLVDWTEFKVNLLTIDKTKTDPYLIKKMIMEYHSPTKEDGKTFIAEGETDYENSFTFNATIPYQHNGWSKSKDLRKMDQKELLAKTEGAYKLIWNLMDENKKDEFFGYFSTKEVEVSQSYYSDQAALERMLKSYMEPFTNSTYKMEPLENYKMVLYGDGRVVCMEQLSMDERQRGRSALWAKFKNEKGSTVGDFRKLYLHIPEGKNAFEVIR